ASRTALIQGSGIQDLPARIVEIEATSVGCVIVGLNRLVAGLPVWTGSFEIHLDNFGVAVAPLSPDRFNSICAGKVHSSARRAARCLRSTPQQRRGQWHDDHQEPN